MTVHFGHSGCLDARFASHEQRLVPLHAGRYYPNWAMRIDCCEAINRDDDTSFT